MSAANVALGHQQQYISALKGQHNQYDRVTIPKWQYAVNASMTSIRRPFGLHPFLLVLPNIGVWSVENLG